MITCDHPCSMAHSQRPQVLKHVKSRLQVQCAGDLFYGPNFPFELRVVWPAVLKRGLLLKSKLGTTSTKFGCLITFHHDRRNMVITRSKKRQQMFVDCFTALWPTRKSSDKSTKLVSNHKHIVVAPPVRAFDTMIKSQARRSPNDVTPGRSPLEPSLSYLLACVRFLYMRLRWQTSQYRFFGMWSLWCSMDRLSRYSLACLFKGSSSSFSESPSPSATGTSAASATGSGAAEEEAAKPNDVSSNWMVSEKIGT